MTKRTTFDANRPVEQGDIVDIGVPGCWEVTHIDGYAEGCQFVDVKQLY